MASGWESKMPGSSSLFSSNCWALLSRFTTSQWRARFLVAARRESVLPEGLLNQTSTYLCSLDSHHHFPSPAPTKPDCTLTSWPALEVFSFWMLLSRVAFSAQLIPMCPSCLSLTSPFPDLLLRQLGCLCPSLHNNRCQPLNLSCCWVMAVNSWWGEERSCLCLQHWAQTLCMRALEKGMLEGLIFYMCSILFWEVSMDELYQERIISGSKIANEALSFRGATWLRSSRSYRTAWHFRALTPHWELCYCAKSKPWFPLVILIFISTLWPLVWQWGDSWAKRLNSLPKVAQLIAGGQRSHRSCLAASTQG